MAWRMAGSWTPPSRQPAWAVSDMESMLRPW